MYYWCVLLPWCFLNLKSLKPAPKVILSQAIQIGKKVHESVSPLMSWDSWRSQILCKTSLAAKRCMFFQGDQPGTLTTWTCLPSHWIVKKVSPHNNGIDCPALCRTQEECCKVNCATLDMWVLGNVHEAEIQCNKKSQKKTSDPPRTTLNFPLSRPPATILVLDGFSLASKHQWQKNKKTRQCQCPKDKINC